MLVLSSTVEIEASQDPAERLFRPTVLDDLVYGPGTMDIPPPGRLDRLRVICNALGIEDLLERSSADLSGGERKAVSVAAALIDRPEVLVLDEPAQGLSPSIKQRLISVLRESPVAPQTLVLATHDMGLAESLCERAILLSPHHRKVADGPTRTILAQPGLLLSAELIHEHGHSHGGTFHLHRHSHGDEHEHLHESRN